MAVAVTSPGEAASATVELAARGDEAAFATLVRQYHADMTRVAFVICGDRDLADEAVAAAWPIAWRTLRTLREPDRVRHWLVAIAANEARQVVRRRRRRAVIEVPLPAEGRTHAGDPGRRAADLDLANALAQLDPRDRALLALRYMAGLNATELARATGMSASGTRTRLQRLLARLRTELGDD